MVGTPPRFLTAQDATYSDDEDEDEPFLSEYGKRNVRNAAAYNTVTPHNTPQRQDRFVAFSPVLNYSFILGFYRIHCIFLQKNFLFCLQKRGFVASVTLLLDKAVFFIKLCPQKFMGISMLISCKYKKMR